MAVVRVPVGAVVAAGPVVQRDAERGGERGVARAEGIVGAAVQPQARAAGWPAAAGPGDPDEVVAGEALSVVERARSRLAAGQPHRGRVPADGAEPPGRVARDVEGAEAAHRDAAD